MAGTRLFIHTTFMVELLLLILCSYQYAINKPHNSTQSAEPFFANQSGYKLLVEDVTPIPSSDGIISDGMKLVVEYIHLVKSFIYELIGIEVEKVEYQYKPRRISVFVKEMRDQVSNINKRGKEEDAEDCKEDIINVSSPPLQLNLRLPLTGSTDVHIGLAQQLEKAFKDRRTYINAPEVRVGVVEESKVSSRYHMERIDGDLFKLPTKSIKQHSNNSREVKHPELLIIMGCVHTIPKDEKITVEIVEDIILVRVRVEHIRFLYDILEEIVDKVLSNIFASLISKPSLLGGYKMNTVSINLIDEDPSSYISETTSAVINYYTAKTHFDIIGKAFSSSVTSTISPILEDLSFIYGGQIKVTGGDGDDAPNLSISSKNTIRLEVQSTAYLPLPDRGWNDIEDDGQKLIARDSMANWLNEHSSQPINNGDDSLPDTAQWTLVVPSAHHAPLTITSDGGESTEMMISPTTFDPSKSCGIYPNGLSIINPSIFREYLDDSNNKLRTETLQPNSILLDDVYQGYKNNTKRSLGYLVSAIRGIHGLPPSSCDDLDECCECDSKIDCVPLFKSEPFSFWELESIARSHYSTTLETVLDELDSLHAVLYHHGNTLAFPEELAYKLNNATHLLRQSITLAGEGYPAIYTTSLLYGSLSFIESVQTDYQFHELPYFAIDHYLAVFSPLVLPLLLPMIAGLIREVKRFKEHKKKRTSFFASMNSF